MGSSCVTEDNLRKVVVSSTRDQTQVIRLHSKCFYQPSWQHVQANHELTLKIKLALTLWSSCLRLPSSWDYRPTPPGPTLAHSISRSLDTRIPSDTQAPRKHGIKIPFSRLVTCFLYYLTTCIYFKWHYHTPPLVLQPSTWNYVFVRTMTDNVDCCYFGEFTSHRMMRKVNLFRVRPGSMEFQIKDFLPCVTHNMF